MTVLFHLLRKELLSLFVSPVAYVVLFVFLLVNGVTFYFYLSLFNGNVQSLILNQFGFIPFWFLALLTPPLLTMRSFAEERRTGTFELLVTTGVPEWILVLGKFLASWIFYVFLWASTLVLFLMLSRFTALEWGVLATVLIGLTLAGSVFTAVGIFASSLTSNQLVAAGGAMSGGLLIFFVHYFRHLFDTGRFELRYYDYVSPYYHFQADFARGVFDLRYVLLYSTVTIFFLFLTCKVLERRRWW